MFVFTKFINKNDDGYNYIDIQMRYKNSISYSYNLFDWFYNVFYKDMDSIEDKCTLTPPKYELNSPDRKGLYPMDNIKINDFNIMISTLDKYIYDDSHKNPKYEEYVSVMQKMFGELLKFDKNMIIYVLKPLGEINTGSRRNPEATCRSKLKNIGNDISQIKYMHEYSNIYYGVNVIIKSKIIDLGLIYYLINKDMVYIKIYKNFYNFRLKDSRDYNNDCPECRSELNFDISSNVDISSDKYTIYQKSEIKPIDTFMKQESIPKNVVRDKMKLDSKDEVMSEKDEIKLENEINKLEEIVVDYYKIKDTMMQHIKELESILKNIKDTIPKTSN